MLTLNVTADLKTCMKQLDGFRSDQFAFAVAKALTKTAQDAQKAVRDDMPNRFTLRRQWIVQGIRIEKATKSNLTAMVYSRDRSFMDRQEGGGIKAPKYGSNLALPMPSVRRTKTQIIAKSELPGNLKNKFIIHAKDGRVYLANRFAKGKRAGVQLMYELRPKASVKPRLGMHDITNRIVQQNFQKNLIEAMQYAMRTAR